MPEDAPDRKTVMKRYADRCAEFDEAGREAESEIRSGAWDGLEDSEIENRFVLLAQRLPQAEVIPTERMARWAAIAFRNEIFSGRSEFRPRLKRDDPTPPEVRSGAIRGVLWHVRRLSGIGGSECGDVVKHYRGERGDFGDGVDVVKQKLMFWPPRIGTDQMRRGHRLEGMIRDLYHQTRGDVLGSDEEAIAKMKGFRSERAPFMIGNADDIVIVRSEDGSTRRRIPDYKAPSSDVFSQMIADSESGEEVPFGYRCQLHLYGVVCALAGIKVAELELAPFDYARGAVGATRANGERLFLVPYDKDLANEIHQGCLRIVADHVMTGLVPDKIEAAEIPLPATETAELAFRLSLMKAIESAAKKEGDEIRADLEGTVDSIAPGAVGKADFGHAALTIRRKWDESELRASALSAGLDPEDFTAPGKASASFLADAIAEAVKALEAGDHDGAAETLRRAALGEPALDADALAAAVGEAGVTLRPAEGSSTTYALTRKSAGEGAVALAALKEFVAGVLGQAEDDGLRGRTAIMRGESPGEYGEEEYGI